MNDKRQLLRSMRLPLQFVALLWLIKGMELITHSDFSVLGNYPRKVNGIIGIFASPLIHGDMAHLMSNSVPIIILGALVLFFYPSVARRVVVGIYLLTGMAVWILARPVYHIGASGIVYGLAFFLFFSGVFRNDIRSLAVSFFIIFMYGGIIWGLAPYLSGVSWESHLFGALSGSFLAFHYRHKDVPPPPKEPDLFQHEEEEISYRYIYVPKSGKDDQSTPHSTVPDGGNANSG
ncbi:MAG: rhomboid family intramembrane serine protease [Chitinophagales bacterium]|nr:MAG: rhomboid family intramembrane serine protease [Chitinophagales bacterium]